MTLATVYVPPWVAVLVLIGLPLAAWYAHVYRLVNRDLTATDRYCGLVDRDLDAGVADVVEDWETRQELENDRVQGFADQLDAIRSLPQREPYRRWIA